MTSRNVLIAPVVFISMVTVIVVYWWGYKSPVIGIDDANIYFVYMRNLAEGHGFVWNTGGERVEGFTSLIWTLFGALAYKITSQHFNLILLAANFLLIFTSITAVLRLSRRLNGTEREPVTSGDMLIISLLILPLGFIEWGIIALMETGLWTFLIVHLTLQLCYYLLDHNFSAWKFSVMIILLDLTRPESMVLSIVFIAILFGIVVTEKGWLRARTVATAPLVLHIVTLASIILWRLWYFGYPFPNTFYAKVSSSEIDNLVGGVKYLFRFFYSYPHAAIATGILVLFLVLLFRRLQRSPRMIRKEEKILAVLMTVIFAGLAQPVLTGGDHFLYSRFYQPYLPLLYVAVTWNFFCTGYLGLYLRPRKLSSLVLVLPVIFGILFFSKFTMFDFMKKRNSVNFNILPDFFLAKSGRRLGDKMNETFGGLYPSLGALATGSIAYSYKGKTIDLLGLNNTTMAHASSVKVGYRNHASFEKEGFWKLSPDMLGTFMGAEIIEDTALFVLPENTKRYRTSDFTYLCYKGIFDDGIFRNSYLPALVKNKSTDYFIFSYYKRSFLSTLQNKDEYFVRVYERRPVPPDYSAGIRSLVADEDPE